MTDPASDATESRGDPFRPAEEPQWPADAREQPAPDAPADERDWQSEYRKEVARSRKYRRRAQEAEQALQALRETALSEQQLAEYAALKDRCGQFGRAADRIARLEAMVEEVAGRDALIQALVSCGVGQGFANADRMIEQAVRLLRPALVVETGGERPVVRIASDGEAEEDGAPETTVQQYVTDWLAREGAHFLPASRDTGSGAHRGSAGTAGATLAQLDANPTRKAKFIAENGPEAYVQLARKRR